MTTQRVPTRYITRSNLRRSTGLPPRTGNPARTGEALILSAVKRYKQFVVRMIIIYVTLLSSAAFAVDQDTAKTITRDPEKNVASTIITDYVFPVYAGDGGTITGPASPDLNAFSPEALPDYARSALNILKENRPPRYVAEQAVLVKGMNDVEYLIVKWNGCDRNCPSIELHRLRNISNGGVNIKFLRQISGEILNIIKPTGQTVFANEPAVAVIFHGSGGSGSEQYYIHVIQMKKNSVDIIPDWVGRPVDLVDLDQDGSYELVTIDPRWRAFYDIRGAAGPHIPVIFRRKDSQFIPACRDFKLLYTKSIEELYTSFLQDGLEWGDWEYQASIVLRYIQIGELEKAQTVYNELLQGIAAHISPNNEYYGNSLGRTKKTLGQAIEKARSNSNAQCALLQTD